jgi:hypothetical protein
MAIKRLYKMNGNLTDYSGNGQNLNGNVVTYVPGAYGLSASFNGSSSYANNNYPFNCGTGPYSFFMMVNTNATSKVSPCESGTGIRRFISLYTGSNYWGAVNMANSDVDYGSMITATKTSIWSSVAGTFYNDGTAKVDSYLDSGSKTSSSAAATYNVTQLSVFYVGALFNWSTQVIQTYWAGKATQARWENMKYNQQYVNTLHSYYKGLY